MVTTEACDVIEDWNRHTPSGSPVVIMAVGATVRTKTRGLAFELNGRPVITLLGVAGAVDLHSVRPRPWVRWVRLNRRGQQNHWIHEAWQSREEMEADIAVQMRRDSRIESFETSATRPLDA